MIIKLDTHYLHDYAYNVFEIARVMNKGYLLILNIH